MRVKRTHKRTSRDLRRLLQGRDLEFKGVPEFSERSRVYERRNRREEKGRKEKTLLTLVREKG